MCQRIPRMDMAGLPAGVYIAKLAARREFAPGTGAWRLSPSRLLAKPPRLVSKKANANHVPYTNPEITS